jgi:hypothetical protein
MSTGREMFQGICDKLCKITDEVAWRQKEIIQLSSQASNDTDIEDSLAKLGEIELKFRPKADFEKLIEQHFSKNEVNVDVSKFTKDLEAIKSSIEESNKVLLHFSKNAENERNERQILSEKMELAQIESQNWKARIEREMQEREAGLAKNLEIVQMKKNIKDLERRYAAQAVEVNNIGNKCRTIEMGTREQKKLLERQEAALGIYRATVERRMDEEYHRKMNELQQVAEESRKVAEECKQSIQQEVNDSKNDVKQYSKKKYARLEKKFNDSNETIKNSFDNLQETIKEVIQKVKDDEEERKRIEKIREEEEERRRQEEERRRQEEDRIRQEEEEKKNPCILYLVNPHSTLEVKKAHCLTLNLENFKSYFVDRTDLTLYEIKFTDDRKYAFVCKTYIRLYALISW